MSDGPKEYSFAGLSYWEVRKAIEKAAKEKNDRDLKCLELLYPDTFKQMVSQASRAMRDGQRELKH